MALAVPAPRPDAQPHRAARIPIRLLQVGVTLATSIVLGLIALQVPPFVPAGADGELSNAVAATYSANIWPETQVSLLVLAIFLPWLVYATIYRGAMVGRVLVFAVALLGVAVSTWAVTVSLESYMARPEQVSGIVVELAGRDVTLDCGVRATYHLVITDRQLQAAEAWLRPGGGVSMWVSPRGHAGEISPGDGACGQRTLTP